MNETPIILQYSRIRWPSRKRILRIVSSVLATCAAGVGVYFWVVRPRLDRLNNDHLIGPVEWGTIIGNPTVWPLTARLIYDPGCVRAALQGQCLLPPLIGSN